MKDTILLGIRSQIWAKQSMVLEVKRVITSGEKRGREGFLGYQQYFFIWVMIIQVYSDNL